MRVRSAAPCLASFLLVVALCFHSGSAFVCWPITGLIHVPRSSSILGFAKDVSKSPSEVQPKLPISKQVLKIRSRLQEIERAEGETLSQEYCDSILGLCVAADEWESVLYVLDIMKSQGLSQERSSYEACLQACFEMGNGASAREILQAMQHALVEPLPADIGLVAAAMCRNNKQEMGWWRKAKELLLSNPSPHVPIESFDAVLACLCDECNWREAIRLLRELERGSEESRKKKLYPKPTLATYREVIECCVASNQVEQAIRLVNSMDDKGLSPTVYTFELVISALSKKLQWRRALQLLDLMEKCERPKTVLTYNTIISACARAKEVGIAKNLLSRMKKEGIKPSIVTYNSLISGCASSSRWKDAMAILDMCNRDPHCTPDIYTYTNAIRACAKARKAERALTLHDLVRHKKLPLDSYFYAAVIEACAKAKMWKKALELLHEMEEEGVPATEVIYSVTITACGNAGNWQKALELLDLMREKGMRINLYVYNSAITALAKAAKKKTRRYNQKETDCLSPRAMALLDQMKVDGIEPDGFSFSSAISCFGAEGNWEEALGLMDQMRQGGPRTRPNKIAYTAAIAACGRAGESETALRLFLEMRGDGLSADRVAYNALFSALRVAREADTAHELWEEMCGKNPSKSTSKAIATADQSVSPDIITVTDVIATLRDDKSRVDKVFAEAVELGIVLGESKVSLDSLWEVDLSSMSFPVARAACRYVLQRACQAVKQGQRVQDLSLITGVGNASRRREGKQKLTSSSSKATSKREYIQESLREDFNPPIESFVPKLAQGTVKINKSTLQNWIEKQATTH